MPRLRFGLVGQNAERSYHVPVHLHRGAGMEPYGIALIGCGTVGKLRKSSGLQRV